ncbi:MAG: exodeoxyribonuclease VII small subunit [Clostridiales bacterium]|nr:exodeoxyribonuclease VII small subunit [Clostridiales bacterium]
MENTKTESRAVSADFEKKIAELQRIVEKLESDSSVSLEDSMKLYESGLELTKECVQDLNAMQSRISDLNRQLDSILQQPLFGDRDE